MYSSHGLRIFADEVCAQLKMSRLSGLVHGVNVKMEKCGGYRGGLRAYAAEMLVLTFGLDAWLALV